MDLKKRIEDFLADKNDNVDEELESRKVADSQMYSQTDLTLDEVENAI